MSTKKADFVKDLTEALQFIRENPHSLKFLESALKVVQTSRSPARYGEFFTMLKALHPDHAYPIAYFFQRAKQNATKTHEESYPEEVSTLQNLKLLYGEAVRDAQTVLRNPLGVQSIFDRFSHAGVTASPGYFVRHDGATFEVFLDASDVATFAVWVLGMVKNHSKNGGSLSKADRKRVLNLLAEATEALTSTADDSTSSTKIVTGN